MINKILIGILLFPPLAWSVPDDIKSKIDELIKNQNEEMRSKLSPTDLKKVDQIQVSDDLKKAILDEYKLKVFIIEQAAHNPFGKPETIKELDLSKQDLKHIDLSKLKNPLPQKYIVGAPLTFYEPFIAYTQQGNDREQFIQIPGQSVLRIDRIEQSHGAVDLFISDDRGRKFSMYLNGWIESQHTESEKPEDLRDIMPREGDPIAIVVSDCMLKIGDLKDKCFNLPHKTILTSAPCPTMEGFPKHVQDSFKLVCGHAKNPQLTLKRTINDDKGDVYLVEGDLETLFYLKEYKIITIDHWRARSILSNENDAREKLEKLKTPSGFEDHLEELAEKKDNEAIKKAIEDAAANILPSGLSQLQDFINSNYSSPAQKIIFRHYARQGDWNYVLDNYIAPEFSELKMRDQEYDKELPLEMNLLKLLFSSSFSGGSEIRQLPDFTQSWIDFMSRHKFYNIHANYSFFVYSMGGRLDPIAEHLKKLGYAPGFTKAQSFTHNSTSKDKQDQAEANLIAGKHPFILPLYRQEFKIDGKACAAAIKSDLESEYFKKGVCRLYPIYGLHGSACVPREKYPPNAEGYLKTCRDNFRNWAKVEYPQYFSTK